MFSEGSVRVIDRGDMNLSCIFDLRLHVIAKNRNVSGQIVDR